MDGPPRSTLGRRATIILGVHDPHVQAWRRGSGQIQAVGGGGRRSGGAAKAGARARAREAEHENKNRANKSFWCAILFFYCLPVKQKCVKVYAGKQNENKQNENKTNHINGVNKVFYRAVKKI